ncbi:MAG: nucleotidyltransferase family protein [Bryobacterales bacterium]|nr:nucleotidyltransferase family protein [Bryobacterales bacterium]
MQLPVDSTTRTIEDRERLAARIGVPMSTIEAFCDRWQLQELALFGSVLRDDFGPDSDIDILVRFRTQRTPGLFGFAEMERELAELLGRRVDLVHRPAIKGSRNYIRRKAILGSARIVYAA